MLISIIVVACGCELTDNPRHFGATVVVYFYVINKTGKPVELRVFADGDELFARRMDDRVAASAGKQLPPASPFPAQEIKTSLRDDARQLEVQLTPSGARKTFDIRGFGRSDAGFRIVIGGNNVSLAQDYYPVR